MGWIVLAAVAVIALVVGAGLGFWAASAAARDALHDLEHNLEYRKETAWQQYLKAVRREIGNALMARDHHRFVDITKRSLHEIERIESQNESLTEEFSAICQKYPSFEDFAPLRVRDHVLYAELAEGLPIEDLEENYLDIIRFMAIKKRANPHWRHIRVLTANDLEHLEEYVERIDDTRLYVRLVRAIDMYFTLLVHDLEMTKLETMNFSIQLVPHFAENRYGVHFKATGEYGIYGTFSDGDKDYESYYRSDANFETAEDLDCLPDGVIDEQLWDLRLGVR